MAEVSDDEKGLIPDLIEICDLALAISPIDKIKAIED